MDGVRIKWLLPNSRTRSIDGAPVKPGETAIVDPTCIERHTEGVDYTLEPEAAAKPKPKKTTKKAQSEDLENAES
jgi:hypothetical protein